MKTQEVLKELKNKNIYIPHDWAVLQSSTGVFLGFLPTVGSVKNMYVCKGIEKLKMEKEAIKKSRLSQL